MSASINQSEECSSVKHTRCQINVSYRGNGHSASNTFQWKSCLPLTIDCWVNIRHSNRALSSLDDAMHGIPGRYHSLINDRASYSFCDSLVDNLVHDYHLTLWSLKYNIYVALGCYGAHSTSSRVRLPLHILVRYHHKFWADLAQIMWTYHPLDEFYIQTYQTIFCAF